MGDLKIDKTTYGNIIRRGVDNNVTVGKYCSIAANCVVDSGIGHKTDVISTWPFDVFWHKKPTAKNGANTGTTKGDIVIGNDVWIGEDVVIMSGVKIGDGAVVGLRSVVTRDVPPYSIVAGVPAKVKKYRFPPEIIEKLLKVRWWDWPEEKIRQHSQLLVTSNFAELFRIAGV